MKLIISVVIVLLITVGYFSYTEPSQASSTKEGENGFITTGQKYCEDHASLRTVVAESKSIQIKKLNDDGKILESQSTELVIMFLCKDEYIFVLAGPDVSKLGVYMIKPDGAQVPKAKNGVFM